MIWVQEYSKRRWNVQITADYQLQLLYNLSWGELHCFIPFFLFLLAAAHTYKQVAQNNPDVPGPMPAPVCAEIQSDPKELVEQGHSDDP